MSIRKRRVPENRMRVVRAERHITQFQLAHKSGVPTSAISMIENRHKEPSEREAMRLARALRVTVTDLFPPVVEHVPVAEEAVAL